MSPWAPPLLPQPHQHSTNSQPPPWGTNRPSHHLQTANSRGICLKANSALGSVNTVSCTEKMRKIKKEMRMFWCPAVSSPRSEPGLSEPSLSLQRERGTEKRRGQGKRKRSYSISLKQQPAHGTQDTEGGRRGGEADFWLHYYCRLPVPRNSVRACKPYISSPRWSDAHTRETKHGSNIYNK